MAAAVNLAAKLATFDAAFSPRIIAELNDYKVAVARSGASSSGIRTPTPTTSSSFSPAA